MNAITKVSEITAYDIADYLRIAQTDASEINFFNMSLKVAKDFILKYTGIADLTELDKYDDMITVVFVLCQDMYDTRALYVDSKNINTVIETILGMHQRNLL